MLEHGPWLRRRQGGQRKLDDLRGRAQDHKSGHIGKASVYANAFGANLPKRRASDRPVFKAMCSFGVGEETTNAADGLLVYGKDDSRLQADFDRLVAVDPVYGATVGFPRAAGRLFGRS